MPQTTTTKACRNCQGTGYLPHFSRIDGGKCWACTDKADTSYTRHVEVLSEDEFEARRLEANRLRSIARRQRRAAAQ
jgi:hypothetical protein